MKTKGVHIFGLAVSSFSLLFASSLSAKELKPCGLVGSIEQRIDQCSQINPKQAKARKNWELVSVSKREKELYLNRELQMVWTDIMGYGVYEIDSMMHGKALEACATSSQGQEVKVGLALNFRLPDAAEAQTALDHGLKKAFSEDLFFGSENAGNNRGSMLPSWTSYSFFTADFKLGKGDRHYALRYTDSSVKVSGTSIEYYEGTYGVFTKRPVLYGGDRSFVRCVASVSNSDLITGSVTGEQMTASLQPSQIKSIYSIKEFHYGKLKKPESNDQNPTMEQPCVEFTSGFDYYKRILMPPQDQIQAEDLEFLRLTRGYESLNSVFCTRDDSDNAIHLTDNLAAPSRPLFISKDGTHVKAYDYEKEKFEEMWSIVGKADNGEPILIHRGLQILVGPRQEKPMENKVAVELAKTYQMSFIANDGQRITVSAGKSRLPKGREWNIMGRDGILQLRKDGWNRDSIWTANKSGTFLSGDFRDKNGELVGAGSKCYFTGFETGPWGSTSTAVGINSPSGERKAVFVVPLKDLDMPL